MHRLPSKSSIRRFRLAAVLLISKNLLIPLTLAMLVYSALIQDRQLAFVAVGMAAATGLVTILLWMTAARTSCPLCMTPVLARKSCSKHRRARKMFGSYRLRAALAILFKNSFHCPYCNEPTALEVRDRSQSQRRYSRG